MHTSEENRCTMLFDGTPRQVLYVAAEQFQQQVTGYWPSQPLGGISAFMTMLLWAERGWMELLHTCNMERESYVKSGML